MKVILDLIKSGLVRLRISSRFRGDMYFDKIGVPIKSTIIKYS